MNTDKHFGESLKKYMTDKGLKANALADKIGISQAGFSEYYKSEYPRPSTRNKILEALGITEDELFGVKKAVVEEMIPKRLYDEQERKMNMLNEKLIAYIEKDNHELRAERQRVNP